MLTSSFCRNISVKYEFKWCANRHSWTFKGKHNGNIFYCAIQNYMDRPIDIIGLILDSLYNHNCGGVTCVTSPRWRKSQAKKLLHCTVQSMFFGIYIVSLSGIVSHQHLFGRTNYYWGVEYNLYNFCWILQENIARKMWCEMATWSVRDIIAQNMFSTALTPRVFLHVA